MLEGATDAELVRRIARPTDDREAEAELCRRFAPRVRLYGLRHLRDKDQAQDLVQSVLLAVLVAARGGRIEDAEHVERFVLGTCRNQVARMREHRDRTSSFDPGVAEAIATMPALDRIDHGALLPCLSKLDERARRILMLSYEVEASADEIARDVATTAGNVRVLRHRALVQLRRCLDRDEGDPT
jgi:RNA polymerase sigma-70 factor (ECF subfamily)